MTKLFYFFAFLIGSSTTLFSQNVSINNTGAAANASAILDVTSTNKGVRIPNVSLTSTVDAVTVPSPANSLLVYNTNTLMTNGQGVGYYYNSGTAVSPVWIKMLDANNGEAWRITGNNNITEATHYLGTTNANGVRIVSNSLDRALFNDDGRIRFGTVPYSTPITNTYNFTAAKFAFNVGTSDAVVVNGAGLGTPKLIIERSNGTQASPTGLTTGSDLGELLFRSINYNGVGYNADAKISGLLENNSGAGFASSGALLFHTSNFGGMSEAMRINRTGNVGIATTAPTARLHIAESFLTQPALQITKTVTGPALVINHTGALGSSAQIINYTGTNYALQVNKVGANSGMLINTDVNTNTGLVVTAGGVFPGLTYATSYIGPAWFLNPKTGRGILAGGYDVGVEGAASAAGFFYDDKLGGLFYVDRSTYSGLPNDAEALATVASRVDEVVYKILGYGAVSTIVPDGQGGERVMAAPESPEVLFQDFGTGTLVNGKARITIDPILGKNIKVDADHEMKVFIQLEGDCKGVFVSNKSAQGFDVTELQQGNSNIKFSWMLSANRADETRGVTTSKYSNMRFKKLKHRLKPTEGGDGAQKTRTSKTQPVIGDANPQPIQAQK
jgi:hypothetical protein